MDEARIVEFTVQAAFLTLILSMPVILVSTILGVLVSLLQALTQIQEQTLGFAIKLIAGVIALLITMRWMGAELYNYTVYLLDSIPTVAR